MLAVASHADNDPLRRLRRYGSPLGGTRHRFDGCGEPAASRAVAHVRGAE